MKTEPKKNGVDQGAKPSKPPPAFQAPAGYEEQTRADDIVGFWDMKLPIHFVPLYAKAFDNHTESTKASILIIGRAIGKFPILDGDGAPIDAEDGDLVGVWYKPGMSAIKNFADVAVFMFPSGELDVGKPKPMKTFSVNVKKGSRGNELKIADDFRKKSAHTLLPLEMKRKRTAGPAEDTDEFPAQRQNAPNGTNPPRTNPDADDIPFG